MRANRGRKQNITLMREEQTREKAIADYVRNHVDEAIAKAKSVYIISRWYGR